MIEYKLEKKLLTEAVLRYRKYFTRGMLAENFESNNLNFYKKNGEELETVKEKMTRSSSLSLKLN